MVAPMTTRIRARAAESRVVPALDCQQRQEDRRRQPDGQDIQQTQAAQPQEPVSLDQAEPLGHTGLTGIGRGAPGEHGDDDIQQARHDDHQCRRRRQPVQSLPVNNVRFRCYFLGSVQSVTCQFPFLFLIADLFCHCERSEVNLQV